MEVISKSKRILVTGSGGMLGSKLVSHLRQKYGNENVIASDLRPYDHGIGPFVKLDITCIEEIEETIEHYDVGWLFNMAAILSVAGEHDPQLLLKVNVFGFQNVVETCRKFGVRLFSASSIGAFGPSSPRNATPDVTIQRPITIYGVSKVHNELVGQYYCYKFGFDFRCLRIPTIFTDFEKDNRGRANQYVTEMFAKAVEGSKFTCDIDKNRKLPFVYIEDCIQGIVQLMEAPVEKLKSQVYNISAFSLSPGDIAKAIKQRIPEFEVDFHTDPLKMTIINSVPESFDDSNARKDWGWSPQFTFDQVVDNILEQVKQSKTEMVKPDATSFYSKHGNSK